MLGSRRTSDIPASTQVRWVPASKLASRILRFEQLPRDGRRELPRLHRPATDDRVRPAPSDDRSDRADDCAPDDAADEPTTATPALNPVTGEGYVAPGAEIGPGQATFGASGFAPGEEVGVTLLSTPRSLGTVTADDAGAASITFEVLASDGAGEHHVVFSGPSGSVSIPFTLVLPGAATTTTVAGSLRHATTTATEAPSRRLRGRALRGVLDADRCKWTAPIRPCHANEVGIVGRLDHGASPFLRRRGPRRQGLDDLGQFGTKRATSSSSATVVPRACSRAATDLLPQCLGARSEWPGVPTWPNWFGTPAGSLMLTG